MAWLRPLVIAAGLIGLWQLAVWATAAEPFILPGPDRVATALLAHRADLARHAGITIAEILLGLALGTALGGASALFLAHARRARPWVLPILVISQAIPVFALAPILALWLGYGMVSKVAMATLIIYFPVTAAFFDGLRRTEPGWLDLARTMGAGGFATYSQIRIPAALPALSSGLRVATSVAPIGAVVGEWVGGARGGLGYLMLHANARLQIDVMFAALLVLAVFAVTLYVVVDRLLRRAVHWQADDATARRN